MNKAKIILTAVALMGSTLACCCAFPTNINTGPTAEVGEVQESEESVPLGEIESATVDIFFGAGELEIAAGEDMGDLFQGDFLYNVDAWEPEVTYNDGKLIVQQGDGDESWNWPPGDEGVRNEWDLRFSPEVALEMDIKAGAGKGDLDLTDLQLEQLDIDLGAGDFTVGFNEPNTAEMNRLTVDVGAASLEINGVGNASPEELVVQGGAGEITLDLTGDWTHSATIEVTAGVGQLTLLLPEDVGVRVDVEGGIANVETSGLERSSGDYINSAYGDAEIELDIVVTTGIGQVNLEVVD